MHSRRTFLGSTAAAIAAPVVYGFPANETLSVGLIGVGGRCRHLLQSLVKIPNVRVVGACDVYEVHREQAKPLVDAKAFVTGDHRALLDRKDIDAVLVATPDHWHVPITIDACTAGKDVYVEKPLTHNLEEGRAVIEAQQKSKRIVQVGTQQRSMPHIAKARELVKAGRLGRVHKVHLTWNRNGDRVRKVPLNIDPKKVDWTAFLGNAPKQEFDEYRFRNWRWFWDFGGGLFTDLMVHWLDVAHWFLDLDHPLSATSIGSYIAAEGVWQTPDTVQTLMTYPNGVQVYFEGTFSNAHNASMIEFMGTDATLYIDRGRYELTAEKGPGQVESMVLGTGPKGRDFYDKPDGELVHLTNWVECVRNRKTPTAPVEAGVSAAAGAHLANLALRSGQVEKWK